MRWIGAAVLWASWGCGAVPPGEVSSPPGQGVVAQAPPPIVVVQTPPPVLVAVSPSCTARLVIAAIARSSPTCYTDDVISRAPGLLTFPCAGGDADALFGAARFVGTVRNGVVDVKIETRFRFTDGCNWLSTQSIHGSLASRQLGFSYTEEPEGGRIGCAQPCTATAVVAVE